MKPLDSDLAARRSLLHSARIAGMVVALLAAAASGWAVWERSDLLEAAIRGAATWLAVLVIWTVALRVGERLLMKTGSDSPAQGASTEPEAELRRRA